MFTSWRRLAGTLFSGGTQLIYPNACWICHQFTPAEYGTVCPSCLPQLTRDPFPTCPRCSSSVGPHLKFDKGCPSCRDVSFAFDGVFRMAPYDGLLRETILRMKHAAGEDLAEVIGRLWANEMAPRLLALGPIAVLPIPLHWTRRWRRGFNQSGILASCLAQRLQAPCYQRILRRTRRTPHQTAQASSQARRDNVHNAFAARQDVRLMGKTVLLVDDVMTSGSTLHEAARALKPLKPRAVFGVVLAHGK